MATCKFLWIRVIFIVPMGFLTVAEAQCLTELEERKRRVWQG